MGSQGLRDFHIQTMIRTCLELQQLARFGWRDPAGKASDGF
jgi:hypothetical protein